MIQVTGIGTNFVPLSGDCLKTNTTQPSKLTITPTGYMVRLNIKGCGIDCEDGISPKDVVQVIQHMLEDAKQDEKVDEGSIEQGLEYLRKFLRKHPNFFLDGVMA
jgi:hypothetical protein